MRETPAIQAAVTRRTEKKRAMKIVFAPCRLKKSSDQGRAPSDQRLRYLERSISLRPPVRPSQ